MKSDEKEVLRIVCGVSQAAGVLAATAVRGGKKAVHGISRMMASQQDVPGKAAKKTTGATGKNQTPPPQSGPKKTTRRSATSRARKSKK